MMTQNEIAQASLARAALLNDGAEACRNGRRRSDNPHVVDTPDWQVWMDGFDQQETWLALGRGAFGSAGGALVPVES